MGKNSQNSFFNQAFTDPEEWMKKIIKLSKTNRKEGKTMEEKLLQAIASTNLKLQPTRLDDCWELINGLNGKIGIIIREKSAPLTDEDKEVLTMLCQTNHSCYVFRIFGKANYYSISEFDVSDGEGEPFYSGTASQGINLIKSL